MKLSYIKKYVLSTLVLCLLATTLFAISLRDYVCVVQVNLPKDTVKYLEGYRDRLIKGGYTKYASEVDSYLKGPFCSGFIYSASDGKSYIITNRDRKSTRLNSSHQISSYAVFCLKKKKVLTNRKSECGGVDMMETAARGVVWR